MILSSPPFTIQRIAILLLAENDSVLPRPNSWYKIWPYGNSSETGTS
jgi:hypothetical protein